MSKFTIYVDGSFNEKTKKGGYGLVIVDDKENVTYEEFKEVVGEGLSMRNVYGEIVGACRAIEICLEHNIKEITLAYDYEGIQKWADGEWKCKNYNTATYRDYIQSMRPHINIKFLKIKSHTGNRFNDMADKLAKKGAGF